MQFTTPTPTSRTIAWMQVIAGREGCSEPTVRGRSVEFYCDRDTVEFIKDELEEGGFKVTVTDCGKASLHVAYRE